MRKILWILFLSVFLIACKSDKEKQNEKFVTNIENEDINSFLNIEYVIKGETETFNYFKGDTLFTNWQYNRLTKNFENYDEKKIRVVTVTTLNYMEVLRNKILSINVSLITQTQWHGQVVKFWTGDTEYFTYVHPDFKFDSGEKTLLEDELKNSMKINDNWYYQKLIVCTNK